MSVTWGAATHAGRVRSVNQDAVLSGPTIFAVADGMGGHAAGEVASTLVIAALAELAEQEHHSREDVIRALLEANDAILARSARSQRGEGMGTTVAGVALCVGARGQDVVVFNVGDSRVYRHTGAQLVQCSVDHSVVGELVAAGQLTAAQAATHPERHTITRAIGVEAVPKVDWHAIDRPSGRFLVCSDGLTNEVTDAEIADALGRGDAPAPTAQRLLDLALDRGARDNVSAVVVDLAGDRTAAAPTDTAPRATAADTTQPRPAERAGADAAVVIDAGPVAPLGEAPTPAPVPLIDSVPWQSATEETP